MSVTLVKASDVKGYTNIPYFTRQWLSTVDLMSRLAVDHGPVKGSRLYEGLTRNNPETLSEMLASRYVPFGDETIASLATVNVPDHKGTTTTDATPTDYSDGYGHTYAVGE
jgi:hypothetical protein